MKSPLSAEQRKVKALLEVAGMSLSKQDFIAAFQTVVKLIERTRAELTEYIRQRTEEVRGKDGRDGEDGRDGTDGTNGRDGAPGPRGLPGPEGRPGQPGPRGYNGRNGSPDTGEEIIKKINDASTLIKPEAIEGYQRLHQDFGGMTEKLKGIEKSHGSQTPAKAFRIHTKDASAQCDGVTKTFTVGGSHFGIVTVSGTQFPVILRPVVDYVETKTGITLTDAVVAPEEGQSLIITFLK